MWGPWSSIGTRVSNSGRGTKGGKWGKLKDVLSIPTKPGVRKKSYSARQGGGKKSREGTWPQTSSWGSDTGKAGRKRGQLNPR